MGGGDILMGRVLTTQELLMLCAKYPLVLPMALCAGLLAGCSGGLPDGKTQQAGAFFISVQTSPTPPEVGSDAEVVAKVQTGDKPSSDCKIRFRQYMPGMEMSSDQTFYDMMQEGASGIYRARGGQFSMGGDWQLEFTLKCGDKTQVVNFPYSLKWPE